MGERPPESLYAEGLLAFQHGADVVRQQLPIFVTEVGGVSHHVYAMARWTKGRKWPLRGIRMFFTAVRYLLDRINAVGGQRPA